VTDTQSTELTHEQHIERIKDGTHEQITVTEDGGCTLTLSEPLTLGTVKLTELRFRRAKMKDLRKAATGASDIETVATMISCLTGQASKVLDELDQDDFKLCAVIVGFLGQPRQRTGTSS